jgi:hypothetical protein
MAAIYDELGNVIGDDGEPSPDQMRYALARAKSRDYTAPIKAAIENMPGSAFVQGVMPIVNFPAQILGSALYGAGKQVVSPETADFNKDTSEAMRATYYTPPSKGGKDYQEALMRAIEVSKLPPYLGHMPPMRVSPSDVRVMGKRAIETGREIAAIPEDFSMAKQGLVRQNYKNEPTYGARLQGTADDIGDALARIEARKSEYATPMPGSVQVFSDMVPDSKMYAVRPTGSQGQVLREVPTEFNPTYNVANEANLTLDLENILQRSKPTKDLEIRTREQPFTNFIPDNFNKSANDLFKDFITPRLQAEFPGLENESLLRAARVKYGDGLNNWMKSQLEDFSNTPEAQAYNVAAMSTVENDPERFSDRLDSLKDVLVVPPSVKLAGMQAADSWVMRNLQNYFVEHVGTESDPGLKEIIETGKSNLIPLEQLEEYADDNARTATSFRNRVGMPTEGVTRPMLVESRTELQQIEAQLQDLQTQFNDLVTANPGVQPAQIPGIKELYKEKQKLTKVKDKVAERATNLEKAILYEDYMDANVRPIQERSFVEDLQPINAQRFPMIPTNKEYMYQMNVPDPVTQLGKDVVSELELGLLTPEAAKSMSVPTAAKMRAELIAKREQTSEKLAQQNIEQLKSYIIEETKSLPQDGKYGKGVVVKFDSSLSKDQIQKAMSSETEWMDHCIGRAGSPEKQVLSRKAKAVGKDNVSSDDKYVGYVPMLASHKPGRVVPKGSSGTSTTWMSDFLTGDGEGRSFRDDATGVPFATMKVKKLSTGPNAGKYSIGEFFGYKDSTVDGPWYEGKEGPYSLEEKNEYRQVIVDWANDHADQLAPTTNDSRRLIKFANIYDMQSPDHRGSLTALLGLPDDELGPIVDQIGKRFVTADQAKAVKKSMEVAPTTELGALKATKKDIERTLRHGGLDDEEEMVLRGQVRDLEDEIRQLEENANSTMLAAVDGAFVEYNSWLVDRHPTIQSRLDQLNDDISEINTGRLTANQFGLNEQEFDEFVRALGREQRNLINQRNAQTAQQVPANQPQEIAPLTEVLDMEMNRIRDNYGEEMHDEVDRILTAINDNYDLEGDTPLFIERIRQRAGVARIGENNAILGDALEHAADLLVATERNNIAVRRANNQAPQQIQAEPTAIQRVTLQAAQNEAFGTLEPALNQDARNIVDLIALQNPTELNVIGTNVMTEAVRIANGSSFRHLAPEDRSALSNALNDFAQEIAPTQAPALRAQRVENMALIDMTPADFVELQGNIVQNLINQYPEGRQIQALIDDLERGEYDELPAVIREEMDENQADSFVTQIIGELEQYRDALPAERNEDMQNMPITEAYQAFVDEIASAMDEGSFDPNNYSNEDLAQMILDDQVGGEIGNLTPESRERLAREVREFGVDPYHEPETQRQYTNATQAFNGLLEANNNFMLPTPEEGLNTLRAVPQLLNRENLREHFGTTRLSQRQRQELEQHVNRLIYQRTENILPPPEGHKRGGLIKKNSGGKVEPTSPSPSVNDKSKPVEPVKKINNPDAPEFKDIFNRERAIRGGTQSGSGGADLKQLMNPRAYADGGSALESYEAAKRRRDLEKYERLIQQPPPNYDDGAGMLFNRMGRALDLAHPNAGHRKGYADDYTREHMERLRQEDIVRRGTPMIANGGSIQSSKNRLLSPNTDEMRYALMKGK